MPEQHSGSPLHRCASLWLLATAALAGCAEGSVQADAPQARYQMECEPFAATVMCFRMDTFTGRVQRVDAAALPMAEAVAADTTEQVEAFQLRCDTAIQGERRALQCVRLDRRSGAMVHLHLSTLPELTEAALQVTAP